MTTNIGEVEINIVDGIGAAVVVPLSSVQLVIGTATEGTPGQVVASKSTTAITNAFGSGQLVEYCCNAIAAGGTVLAMRAADLVNGYVNNDGYGDHGVATSLTVSAASNTNLLPITITTSTAHGLHTGQIVAIQNVNGQTNANGYFVITKTGTNTFTIPTLGDGTHAYTSGGTVSTTGVFCNPVLPSSPSLPGLGTFTQSTSVVDRAVLQITLGSLHGAFDDYNVCLAIVNDGNGGSGTTVGTNGIQYRLSLDAGRTFGPVTALRSASSISLTGTGITLGLRGNLFTGDVYIFSTTGMTTLASNAAPNHGVAECLLAAAASPYAITGWGSTHILGQWDAADIATLTEDTTGTVDTLPTQYVFTRAMISSEDASPPVIWGGTGETETHWASAAITGLVNAFSQLSAKRGCVGAGFFNIAGNNPTAMISSRMRRPGMWAQAVRELLIPPQRHSGRVKDGPLGSIILDPANDGMDGFIYHDERISPMLDAARFCSFRTRLGRQGMFVANPNLMSPAGSLFSILPLGNVMDVACTIVHQVGEYEINDDLRLNLNGTLVEKDAVVLEGQFTQALNDQMLATSMISGDSAAVDRTTNVATTHEVDVTVNITARGYILSETITLGFSTPQSS